MILPVAKELPHYGKHNFKRKSLLIIRGKKAQSGSPLYPWLLLIAKNQEHHLLKITRHVIVQADNATLPTWQYTSRDQEQWISLCPFKTAEDTGVDTSLWLESLPGILTIQLKPTISLGFHTSYKRAAWGDRVRTLGTWGTNLNLRKYQLWMSYIQDHIVQWRSMEILRSQ